MRNLKANLSVKQGIEGNLSIPSALSGVREEELVTINVADEILQLTTDKYQTAIIEENVTLLLPDVEEFVEIHFYFKNRNNVNVFLPNEVKWKGYPLVTDDIIELKFVFINNEWLGELIKYEEQVTPVMDGLICWLDGRDGEGSDIVWKDRSGNGNNANIIGQGHVWTGESLRFTTGSNTNIFEAVDVLEDATNYTLEIAIKINETRADFQGIILANTKKIWNGAIFLAIHSELLRLDPGARDFDFSNYNKKNIITIARKGGSSTLYINGVLIKTFAQVLTSIKYLANWDNAYSAKADYYSVKVYNRALTDKEIQENYIYESSIKNTKTLLENRISNVEKENDTQDEVINTTMMATDELFMMLEPLLLSDTYNLERSVSKMVEMYVAMIQRGIKTIDQVPTRYREQVKELLSLLED